MGLRRSQLLYVPLSFDSLKYYGLIDTGAFTCAMPIALFEKIRNNRQTLIELSTKLPQHKVRVANGQEVEVLFQAKLKFELTPDHNFTEDFLILPHMNSVILGLPFFDQNGIKIDIQARHLDLPDITFQLNTIRTDDGQFLQTYPKNTETLKTTQRYQIQPNGSAAICVIPANGLSQYFDKTGRVEPISDYEHRTGLCISFSLNTIHANGTLILVLDLNPHMVTIPKDTNVAKFSLLSCSEMKFMKPVPTSLLSLPENELNKAISSLFSEPCSSSHTLAEPTWFPTPETCEDPSRLNPLEKKIYDQLLDFKRLESARPADNDHDQ